MRIEFLSHPINEDTPLYKGHKKIQITAEKSIANGNSCNELILKFPNHTSTHVDLPYHFIPNGRKLTDYGAKDWYFEQVALLSVKATPGELIDVPSSFLSEVSNPGNVELLLLQTGFECYRDSDLYWKEPPGLSPALANRLFENFPRLRALGMDILSTGSPLHPAEGRSAHKNFLEKGILLIEDMKLHGLKNAPTRVLVAPLLLDGADAAPVSVFAFFEK